MARKPHILIVDDEVNVTRTLQMIFEKDGYKVTPAFSSEEAVEILQNGHRFDAVMTDLNMEREDIGLKVVLTAKKLRPQPVVLIYTGYANLGNSREALMMHVDYLATKPADLEELKST